MLLALAVSMVVVLSILNTMVTRHVWADPRRTKQERLAETGLVWCVPLFGALLALAISAENPARVRRSRGLFGSAAGSAATSSWPHGS